MTRVILDCDPGIDDTYALIYLAALNHAGELELDCVTTTTGNVEADQCARNAAYVLTQCGLRMIPLAAGVLAPVGFVLPMSVGALLMSASTIVVALNAQLLRRLDLRPDTTTRAILNR